MSSTTTQVTTTSITTPSITTPSITTPSGATGEAATTLRRSVWKQGIAAAVVASAATTTGASVASAAGVAFSNGRDAGIPIAGFAELTLVFSLVGVLLAAVIARRARRPRSTFLRTTLVLTGLSFVPDLTFGFVASSAATLIALHILAAAIVIPTLTRRLSAQR